MIIGLTLILTSFIWLLYETDWMRVRLPVGIICEPRWYMPDSAVTKVMKQELIDLSRNGYKRSWGEFKNWMSPLCGWGYAYQYRNFTPEYKVELISDHAKYTFRTSSIPILRDAFRVYRNPYLKVKL